MPLPLAQHRAALLASLALLLATAACSAERPGPSAEAATDAATDATDPDPDPATTEPDAPMNAPLRYLALGDSYTIGESVPAGERWPVQLTASLRAEGFALADPEIIARTGWTTDELDAGIDAAAPAGPYAMVSLLIGVNNQYRGRSLDEYRTQLRALLDRAVGFADGDAARVFMVSIPDWGVTPFAASRDRDAIAADIDRFNAVGAEEAAARNIPFIDITPISRQLAAEGADHVAGDGLHPSGAQYARWAQAALPAARAIARQGAPSTK